MERGLRNVIALGLVSLFNDVSTEMVLSVFPAFLLRILGAPMIVLGAIEGASEAISYLLRAPFGYLSDRMKRRKPLLISGYGLSICIKPLLAFATSWTHALTIRALDRVGKAIRTAPRDALIADSVSRKLSGRAFGLHRSLDQLGAIIGPILAFLLLTVVGYRGVFLISFIPGIAALMVLASLVREMRPTRALGRKSTMPRVSRKLIKYLMITFVFSLGLYNYAFILAYAMEVCKVGPEFTPLIYALVNVLHVISGIPFGMLGDIIGIIAALSLSYLLLGATSLLAASVPSVAALIPVAVIYGFFQGAFETLSRASIATMAKESRGTVYGFFYVALGIGGLIGNSLMGALWDIAGYKVAFLYSALIALISFSMIWLMLGRAVSSA